MGSQTLEILRQGVWASLTGGWFYDPHQDIFCNTFHLYIWMFLLCFPFTLYLYFPPTIFMWTLYTVTIAIVFITIKTINYRMHKMYDTTDCIQELSDNSSKSDDQEDTGSHNRSRKEPEGIEMTEIKRKCDTPPVQCSSRNSISEGISRKDLTIIDSMEFINKLVREDLELKPHSSTIDLKVDVHRNNSSGSSEDTSIKPTAEKVNIIRADKDISHLENAGLGQGERPSTSKSSSNIAGLEDIIIIDDRHSTNSQTPERQLSSDSQEEKHKSEGRSLERLSSKSRQSGESIATSSMSASVPGSSHRFSNMSNLARSLPSSSSSNVLKGAGSLELGFVLEDLDARTRLGHTKPRRGDRDKQRIVRRTRSALETCPGSATQPQHPPPSHPVSLEGISAHTRSAPRNTRYVSGGRSSDFFLRPSFSEDIKPIAEQNDEFLLGSTADRTSAASSSSADITPSDDANHRTNNNHTPLLARHQSLDSPGERKSDDDMTEAAFLYRTAFSNCSLDKSFVAVFSKHFPRRIKISEEEDEPIAISEHIDVKSAQIPEVGVRTYGNSEIVSQSMPKIDRVDLNDDSLTTDATKLHESDSASPSEVTASSMNNNDVKADGISNKTVVPDEMAIATTSKETSLNLPKRRKHEENHSVGSILGLEWLFSPNKESSSSESRDEGSDDTKSSTTLEGESDAVLKLLSDEQSSSSPDDNSLLQTRQSQGAIPKCRPVKQLSSTSEEDHHSRSQSETSLSPEVLENPNELSRRLIEIIYKTDPDECERELRKLKRELDMKRKMEKSPEKESTSDKDGDCVTEEVPTIKRRRVVARRRRHHAGNNSVNSSGRSAELSSLLPPLSTFSNTAATSADQTLSSSRSKRRSNSRIQQRDSSVPPTTVSTVSNLLNSPGAHLASSHDDTTPGAVHCFQDEYGNWLTYTFDENSNGIATGAVPMAQNKLLDFFTPHQPWDTRSQNSTSSESTMILDSPATVLHPPHANESTADPKPGEGCTELNLSTVDLPESRYVQIDFASLNSRPQMTPFQQFCASMLERHQAASAGLIASGSVVGHEANISQAPSSQSSTDTCMSSSTKLKFSDDRHHKPKQYYKFWVIPCKYVKIRFDRLALLALLDRNLNLFENIIAIMLAVLVSLLGAIILTSEFFQDFWIFVFCFVIASSQYSLLKSVQPDAASPTHGFNKIISYSRPVYFCVCCVLVLGIQTSIEGRSYETAFTVYGLYFTNNKLLVFARDLLLVFLLCFPLTFSLGLLPQINTFLMYLLEQIDIHIFGGNACTSLISAAYCIVRSIIVVGILYGFAYGALRESTSSQHIIFSIFCGLLVSVCYHLSRSASDPTVLWSLIKVQLWPEDKHNVSGDAGELVDPLPDKLRSTVYARLKSDAIICTMVAVMVFAIHVSTVFTALQPALSHVLCSIAAIAGLIIHYIIPQLRKQLPWLCCSHPILKSHEYRQFEVRDAAKIMWFEKMFVWLWFLERNIIYPVVFLSALTKDSPQIVHKFGLYGGSLAVVICSMKCLRSCFSDTSRQHLVLIITYFFFNHDYKGSSETFLIDFFITSIIFSKFYEFLLKVRFIITYIAPWQITWGSAFHAFAQPFSVPHSAMLFVQAAVSAILSTPLNPILGSAIFMTSYVRPVKFWERDYNTKRVDHSNTRLAMHLERNPGADDNNLNSIFYEHLTRSLQHSLCGDLLLGRWGSISQGDCYVLASDYLNCLVHIIEVGNGLVTFQMRGLEFRGTYCQQREVEAISEGVEEDEGCCCCEPGHVPHMLSMNAAFNQRWLAWEVTATKYVLEGYSISDNSAASMLQVFDLRKVLITYYVKSIIYYTVRSPKLEEWLSTSAIQEALKPVLEKNFVDLDPVFNMNIDEDYDFRASGISRNSFCNVYLDWVQYCASRREKAADHSRDSSLVSLCFSLSLLGRRALGTASHNAYSSVEFFLFGLHALFKGDFRITSLRDEWVFTDVELLRRVVAPGVRMSLKLHQDHFMAPDEYDDNQTLYDAISSHEQNLVISHEGDPIWRNAVLSSTPSLLALRHVFDDGSDEYKIIMLNKRFLSFRVIKVNRECVRGLWAGQQQELVYLRNRNPERGSIQNAKQALRNLINSSCDQPIGYPIYVSPLTTSYADTHEQLCSIVGGPLSLGVIKQAVLKMWKRLRTRCGEGCSSGGSNPQDEVGAGPEGVYSAIPFVTGNSTQSSGHNTSSSQSGDSTQIAGSGSMGRGSLSRCSLNANANRGSVISNVSSAGKPSSSTLANLAGLLPDSINLRETPAATSARDSAATGTRESLGTVAKDTVLQRIRIIDPGQVYDTINMGRRIDVLWPDEHMRSRGGKNTWKDWVPEKGMEGSVVHRWVPCHRDIGKRSHVDRTILLVRIDDKFVPIAECGVQDLGAEV